MVYCGGYGEERDTTSINTRDQLMERMLQCQGEPRRKLERSEASKTGRIYTNNGRVYVKMIKNQSRKCETFIPLENVELKVTVSKRCVE